MLTTIKIMIFDCLTEPDNKTYCPVRLSFCLSIISAIVLCFYSIYKGNPFDVLAFCTGISALIAAGGAGIGMKTKLGSDSSPFIEQKGEK